MLNQAQCVYLKKASMACNNGEKRLLSTLGLSFLKTIEFEICPKEPCFLVSMTEFVLKSICLLEDKQDKQYAVVGYTMVKKRTRSCLPPQK